MYNVNVILCMYVQHVLYLCLNISSGWSCNLIGWRLAEEILALDVRKRELDPIGQFIKGLGTQLDLIK